MGKIITASKTSNGLFVIRQIIVPCELTDITYAERRFPFKSAEGDIKWLNNGKSEPRHLVTIKPGFITCKVREFAEHKLETYAFYAKPAESPIFEGKSRSHLKPIFVSIIPKGDRMLYLNTQSNLWQE